eukprot:3982772-Lingulodinium_polyedra.AAC.1
MLADDFGMHAVLPAVWRRCMHSRCGQLCSFSTPVVGSRTNVEQHFVTEPLPDFGWTEKAEPLLQQPSAR